MIKWTLMTIHSSNRSKSLPLFTIFYSIIILWHHIILCIIPNASSPIENYLDIVRSTSQYIVTGKFTCHLWGGCLFSLLQGRYVRLLEESSLLCIKCYTVFLTFVWLFCAIFTNFPCCTDRVVSLALPYTQVQEIYIRIYY